MILIKKLPQYEKQRDKFVRNNIQRGEALIKAQQLFVQDPKHPGLNLEKLKGSETWTIRIDKGNRIFFLWVDKTTTLFIDIGEHDKYRKY